MVLDFGMDFGSLFPASAAAGEGMDADAMTQVLWADIDVGIGLNDPNIIGQAHPGTGAPAFSDWGEIARFKVGTEGTPQTIILAWRITGTLKDTGDVSDTGQYRMKIVSNMGTFIKGLGSNGSPGTTNVDFQGTMIDASDILAAGFDGEINVIIEAKMTGDGLYGDGQMGFANGTLKMWVLK